MVKMNRISSSEDKLDFKVNFLFINHPEERVHYLENCDRKICKLKVLPDP